MAVTLTNAARSAAANAVVDLLDVGSTDAAGDIAWSTSAPATLAITALDNPAFGAAANGVATLAGVPKTSAGATSAGTCALALFRDRNNAEVFRCAVAVSSSDINLSNVTIALSDTITLNSLTYTQPA